MDDEGKKAIRKAVVLSQKKFSCDESDCTLSSEASNSSLAVHLPQNEQLAKASEVVKGDLKSVLHVRPYRPHGLKPIPSRVLEEDDYVRVLQMIIERDFFPDLIKHQLLAIRLRLQKEIVEKKRTGDLPGVRDVSQRLEAVRLDQAAHRTRKICGTELLSQRSPQLRVKLLDGREFNLDISKLTLGEFQSLFTSEDNASFERIVQEEKMRLSSEQGWMEQSALMHNLQNEETKSAIENGERPMRLVYSNVASRNPFMFPITDGNVGVMELKQASIGSEGAEQTVALCLGTYPRDQQTKAQPTINRGVIVHANTRIESGVEEDDCLGTAILESMNKEQHRKLERAEKKAKDEALFEEMISKGKYSASMIEHQRQLEQLNRRDHRKYQSQDIQGHGIQTPIITPSHLGYRFVHTPVLDPGVGISPIMTWGKLGATPLLLSGGCTEDTQMEEELEGLHSPDDGPRFEIPEPSKKELTAQSLQDKVTRKLRAQKIRQPSGLRQVLKAVTPLARTGLKFPTTGNSELFGTPKLTGLQLFARHNSMKRTPLIGVTPRKLERATSTLTTVHKYLSTPYGPPLSAKFRNDEKPAPCNLTATTIIDGAQCSTQSKGLIGEGATLSSTSSVPASPSRAGKDFSSYHKLLHDHRRDTNRKQKREKKVPETNITDDLLEF